jgi:hypothetical protein
MIASVFLIAVSAYLAVGLAFALPFTCIGAQKIDPQATRGSWGFRLLILPGAIALWPLLLRRWAFGIKSPPEEGNSHRRAAQKGTTP